LEFEIGAFFAHTATDIEVYDPLYRVDFDLSFESELNLPSRKVLPYLDVEYRFNTKHHVYLDWRRLHRDGFQQYVAKPFQLKINNKIYTIGGEADLLTRLDVDIVRFGYGYNFYSKEHLDVHFLSGLHITRLGLGMIGKMQIDASESTSSPTTFVEESYDTGVTAPLPNLGFLIEHRINEDILLKSHAHAFYLRYGDISGWMYELELATRYYVTNEFSVTGSFNYYNLGVAYDTSHTKLDIVYQFYGPMLKMAYRF
jgi:hypothetical protein